MENNLKDNRRRLKTQIPDIRASLEAVKHLQAKAEQAKRDGAEAGTFNTYYPLADNVFMNATVQPTERVCLWLGADLMVEYTLEEARALLEHNLSTAEVKLKENVEDSEYLQNMIVISEVSIARVINYDVVARRKAKAAATGTA
jgi:prefoldin subunit 5